VVNSFPPSYLDTNQEAVRYFDKREPLHLENSSSLDGRKIDSLHAVAS